MTNAPKSSELLSSVEARLRIASIARAMYTSSLIVLGVSVLLVLASRLLGLVPQDQERPIWLLVIPTVVAVCAGLFHRRVVQQNAARVIDEHARTKDLFLTLSAISTSAGEYQPLVTSAAEQRAEQIVANGVVPFDFAKRLLPVGVLMALLAVAITFTPQLDPFGRVEAATRVEKQKQEIESIKRSALSRADRLKKEKQRADEESEEIDSRLSQLKNDFRKMEPKKVESNSKVLNDHRVNIGDMWKSVASDEQLRRMMNEPISRQQLGGSRNQKMNEWLKEMQQGKVDGLKKQLNKAQETMQAMLEAKDPETREKLTEQLQQELQDLNKFAKDKAGSKELANALNQAMKSLRAANPGEKEDMVPLDQEAMEALKESIKVAELEMERVAQSAEDLKKLETALQTLQEAQKLNANQQLDGTKCEGCESMADYAELYAQMTGQGGAGDGEKDRNEGDGDGVGRGGTTPEDDSDPEGYKKEKEKPQIQAGKILLSIKTKEYAEEKDFDPDDMREYQQNVNAIKQSVQSAIDSEEIPPGYVDGIKGYFDKIENVDAGLGDQ